MSPTTTLPDTKLPPPQQPAIISHPDPTHQMIPTYSSNIPATNRCHKQNTPPVNPYHNHKHQTCGELTTWLHTVQCTATEPTPILPPALPIPTQQQPQQQQLFPSRSNENIGVTSHCCPAGTIIFEYSPAMSTHQPSQRLPWMACSCASPLQILGQGCMFAGNQSPVVHANHKKDCQNLPNITNQTNQNIGVQ